MHKHSTLKEKPPICTIADQRKKRRMSQKDLAHKCGISNRTLQAYEHEEVMPDMRTALLISEALECSVNDLYQRRWAGPNVMPTRKTGSYADLTGWRFGNLIAIERTQAPDNCKSTDIAWWLCQCDCGEVAIFSSNALRKHKTHSCGCRRRANYDLGAFQKARAAHTTNVIADYIRTNEVVSIRQVAKELGISYYTAYKHWVSACKLAGIENKRAYRPRRWE